jgi:hypothetical protein
MGTLASAIAALENTNPVYNNPGAISGTGDTGSSFGAGIGIYSSLSAGQQALENQLTNVYSGTDPLYPGGSAMTLTQFGQAYEGNPSSTYGNSLANILGVPASTPLSAIPSGVGGSTAPQTGFLGALNKAMNALDSVTGASNVDNPAGNGTIPFLGISIHDITVILVGIILIAAGVFAFKQTQTVIEVGTKVGKKISEVAGA